MAQKLSDQAYENKKRYNIEYKTKNYKRVPFDVPVAEYDRIKGAATERGETVNGFIKKAIDMRIDSGK